MAQEFSPTAGRDHESSDDGGVRTGRGLVLGKFLPPHRGHQFLIDFARNYAAELTVMVCTLEREPIAGRLRLEWVRRMFPDVHVVHVAEDLPQEPSEHPDFWNIWRAVIRKAAPGAIDFFFASEDYGHKVAEALGDGCRYVEVDRSRQLVQISGTAVRNDPLRHWDLLPDCVRPYFLKRVCIFGPESTGKSMLARQLASEFETVYAWEYARPLLDPQGGRCFAEDIPRIVRGQVATEEALAQQANRVLFCDTDVLTTTIWSDILFGSTPRWIRSLAEQRTYDLYLVLDVDVPWVDDAQRFFSDPELRRQMRSRFVQALESCNRPYRLISGSWRDRFEQARTAVRELLEKPSTMRK